MHWTDCLTEEELNFNPAEQIKIWVSNIIFYNVELKIVIANRMSSPSGAVRLRAVALGYPAAIAIFLQPMRER